MMRSARQRGFRSILGLAAGVMPGARMVVSPWFHACPMPPSIEAHAVDEHAHHAAQADADHSAGQHSSEHDCRCAASQCGPGGAPAHRPPLVGSFGSRTADRVETPQLDIRLARPPYQLPYATAPPLSL
mgnify:CR=1 FL=1